MLLRIPIIYEKYFQDRFKTYDTFFSFAFRKGKEVFKRVRINGTYFVNEKEILRYFKKREIFELRKNRYIDLLDDISIANNLNRAGIILGYKHSSQIYDLVYKGSFGIKTIKLFKKHYKDLSALKEIKE
ncbi:hypothetical protein [Aliarcobacter butzleri]|uniref:hypothetical protein n=1 Tax=Aliarcobacter butzleri TaxID=28197 RepID=UPI001EDAEE48|nr:hypothetical protein [Aliarcobacter butzleri]MCG3686498.1 hypothetical protein [Aliarcobacter butzleri]